MPPLPRTHPPKCLALAAALVLLPSAVAQVPAGRASPDATVQVRAKAGDSGVTDRRLRAIEKMAGAGLERLRKWFPGTPKRDITFVIHTDSSSVAADQHRGLQQGVPGFARLQRDEIHLIMAEIKIDPPNDLRTTVAHELVHILLDQYVGKNGLHVPRWFHEGLAQVLAGGRYLDIEEERLATMVRARTYLPFKSLRQSFPVDDPDALALAYGQSYSFVAYLRQEVGLEPLLTAAKACSAEAPFYRVLSEQLDKGLTIFELEWCQFIADSGAGFRVILRNCFMLLVVAVVGPLLAFAVARRRNREVALKRQMARQERQEDLLAEAALVDSESRSASEPDGFDADALELDRFELDDGPDGGEPEADFDDDLRSGR